jgi:outer membrane receptor protein involved in Fe transport
MKSITRWIVALALVVFCALGAIAQTSNGTIAGVVTDSTGAAVIGAKVTATSVQTGEVRTATTNSVGAYRFESVLPGSYLLEATAQSFSVTKLTAVQVVASIVTSVNIQLKPGKTSETVEVTAQAEQLQTESGEISSTITTAEVTNLPIASLNAYALAATLPGVTTGAATSFSNGTNFSVNGNRSRANNFLIEGQDNNDAGIAGQGLQPLNLDAIQEVSVMTNSYAAEFGHGGGSVSNLIYKSGTNNFHGAAWELYQGSALDANDHYNNAYGIAKAPYHENIFGFDLGGPITKDKLFFFTSYQWDKYRSAATLGHLWAPTAAGMATLQSEAISPTQQAQLAYLTNMLSGIRGVNNTQLVSMYTDPVTGNPRAPVEIGWTTRSGIGAKYESPEFDVKGDYLVTSNDTLNLRYIKSSFTAPYDIWNWPSQFPGFDAMQGGDSYNAGITYSHVFNPKLINELRLSYGRIGFFFNWQASTFNNPLVDNGNLPSLSITSLTTIGPPSGGPQGRFHNTYQLQDSISWMVGNHSFKFGFDVADIRVADQVPVNWFGNISYATSKVGSVTTGSGLSNFLDAMSGAGTATKTFGSRFVHAPLKSQNYFAQDTWKLRPNLTLTYGLRYEYNAPSAANNMAYPAIDMSNPFPANYPVRIEQQGDKNDWSPRFGLAYTPRFWTKLFGEDKTVIRAGAGIFYDGIFTNILDNNQSGAPNTVPATIGYAVNATTPRGGSNFTWANVSPLFNPVLNPYASVTSIPYNLKNPRTYQWNLNIQRSLPGAFQAQIGYVGTRGTHLYGQDQLNPLNPNLLCTGNGCRLNNTRGSVLVRDNSGDSIYHALQGELDRRMAKGLMFRAAYTWSKTIDTGSEIFTTGNYSSYALVQGVPHGTYDRGLAAQDRRQRLALSYVYDVPQIKGFASFKENPVYSVIGKAVNGWQIAGTTVFQTGAPANVELGYDWNWDGISNDRPLMGNPSAPVTSWAVMDGGQLCDGPAWWNTNDPCHVVSADSVHWIAPPIFSQYNTTTNKPVGRNSYTTPGRQDWTFSITKTIKLGEKGQKLEWRTEMFNPFNHSNQGVPNVTLTSGAVSSQYYNGGTNLFGDLADTISGSRSIRMWLKLSF